MRIKVNRQKCSGHARCWSQAPELFVLDDEGYILPHDIDVPEGQERMAWLGAKSCPERALTIED